jgi:uncharacterized protein YkwD
MRSKVIAFLALAFLASCATPPATPTVDANGNPLPAIYRIPAREKNAVQFRMLDGVNAIRTGAGLPVLQFSSSLNAAAATHSRDMAFQNRPWHFGSDGSSPIDRAARAGFEGTLLGENISETYETELQTLAAWMNDPATRTVILEPNARQLGFEWHQESNGKLWWTLVTGT